MPWCHKCGWEYEAVVTVCPECGGPLSSEPPPERRPEPGEELVNVWKPPSPLRGFLLAELLKDHGIPAAFLGQAAPQVFDGILVSPVVVPCRYLEEKGDVISSCIAQIEALDTAEAPPEEPNEADEE